MTPSPGPSSHDHPHAVSHMAVAVVISVLLGLFAGAGAAWFWFQRQIDQAAGAQLTQLESSVLQLRQELDTERAQLNEVRGQLVVERSTLKGVESVLAATQADLGAAQEKLAFYEQLLPPGPLGSINIRALEVFPVGPHLLEYRLVLMRNAQGRSLFKGRLQFMATGRQEESTVAEGSGNASPALRRVTIELTPARVKSDTEAAGGGDTSSAVQPADLGVSFDQFQRSEGVLGLPEGFRPERITVNVLEGSSVRATSSIDVSAALPGH